MKELSQQKKVSLKCKVPTTDLEYRLNNDVILWQIFFGQNLMKEVALPLAFLYTINAMPTFFLLVY